VESQRPDHQALAQDLINRLMPRTGRSSRLGITGVPGVGKSTTIDQLGVNLIAAGHKVAVLAVDPTSRRTGGSILGDKTRMSRLAASEAAFIRPSPAGETLGGVTRATRKTILVCEAAGFDVILVKTVGVGQSETVVADMVDFFLVLMLAGAGDDLQGIKKGVLELADMVAVNKGDGDKRRRAELAGSEYRSALHLLTPASPTWSPPVLTCSGLADEGLDELWRQIEIHRGKMTATGELQARRREQQVRWMWSMLDERLREGLRSDQHLASRLHELEAAVRAGAIPATVAVDEVWSMYRTSS
jgi:LAO/AO transport system kinase